MCAEICRRESFAFSTFDVKPPSRTPGVWCVCVCVCVDATRPSPSLHGASSNAMRTHSHVRGQSYLSERELRYVSGRYFDIKPTAFTPIQRGIFRPQFGAVRVPSDIDLTPSRRRENRKWPKDPWPSYLLPPPRHSSTRESITFCFCPCKRLQQATLNQTKKRQDQVSPWRT